MEHFYFSLGYNAKTIVISLSYMFFFKYRFLTNVLKTINTYNYFPIPISFKIGRLECIVTIFSTLMGFSLFLKADTTKPAREKTLSLLLLAAGTAKTTRTRNASRGNCSWCCFHQVSWSTSEGVSGRSS